MSLIYSCFANLSSTFNVVYPGRCGAAEKWFPWATFHANHCESQSERWVSRATLQDMPPNRSWCNVLNTLVFNLRDVISSECDVWWMNHRLRNNFTVSHVFWSELREEHNIHNSVWLVISIILATGWINYVPLPLEPYSPLAFALDPLVSGYLPIAVPSTFFTESNYSCVRIRRLKWIIKWGNLRTGPGLSLPLPTILYLFLQLSSLMQF